MSPASNWTHFLASMTVTSKGEDTPCDQSAQQVLCRLFSEPAALIGDPSRFVLKL